MPTDFTKFSEEYEFIHLESICKFNTKHILATGEYMIKNYNYFSIEQWLHNAIYNNEIPGSRAHNIYKSSPFITCVNSFISNNKIKLSEQPTQVENTNETFQIIYKSLTNWLRSYYYDIYKRMIQTKMIYSSCFFSEICEFIQCPYIISGNMFFHNQKEFLKFKDTYNITLQHFNEMSGIDFKKDFGLSNTNISLKNFVVYNEDLYIKNSICYNEIPNGSLYYSRQISIASNSPTNNQIKAYIKRRPYTKVYDQYMSDILGLKSPPSIYSILSSKVYHQPDDYGLSSNISKHIKVENNILKYNDLPIIFYYKTYQITNYKIKFSQNNIYEFYAYHMQTHMIELIKMRKLPPTEYDILEVIY